MRVSRSSSATQQSRTLAFRYQRRHIFYLHDFTVADVGISADM